MSLAKAQSVAVPTGVETQIASWAADGTKMLMGFNAAGPVAATYNLYIGGTFEAQVKTTANGLTAFYVDRLQKPANAVVVSLKVIHQDAANQNFSATILGS